jgi:hypothetical protein
MPTRGDQYLSDQDLTRREEMSVSGAAFSEAPLGAAAVTGAVVTVADLGLHVINGNLGIAAMSGSVVAGVSVFLAFAAAGALWRARSGRAARWARSNPWRFAILPALAAAVIALVLTTVTGAGFLHGILSGVEHGGIVYAVTGAVGALGKSRKRP